MNSQNIAEQYVQEPVCGWEVRCRSAGFNRDAGSGRQDEGHEWESMCSGNIDPGTLPLPPLDDPVTFTLQQLLLLLIRLGGGRMKMKTAWEGTRFR